MTHPLVQLTFWSPGDPRAPAIDALLDDPDAPLAKHGLTGIAQSYARENGASLHEEHRRWANFLAMKSLSVDGAISDVVDTLDRAGVGFVVAKGPVIAYRDYSDAQMRPYTDLDVYVGESNIGSARRALAARGFTAVKHALGALGGLAQEVHGGRFSTVVEVHAHPIDNLHRRHLPPASQFLDHVVHTDLCGVRVPVLAPAADLALQAIHLACGHRYAKLVLLRDIEMSLHLGSDPVVHALRADPYVATAALILSSFGRPTPALSRSGVLRGPFVRSLLASDPSEWDEYRLSRTNVLAHLNQPNWRTAFRAAIGATQSLIPRQGRRVDLRTSPGSDTSLLAHDITTRSSTT